MAVIRGIDRVRRARYDRGKKNILATSILIFPVLMLVRELFRN
jgi:hypothetical protein